MNKSIFSLSKKTAISVAVSSALVSNIALAAEDEGIQSKTDETIVVKGLRSSLKQSMFDKKHSVLVSDGISAEDLGKFPDLNVAESLQRITGVSIDRSGGEGQSVTVRGFGPEFNTVLVNGRQMATENSGREFSFDVLAAEQITGADVYKSGSAKLQEGSIGATINVTTARPFDNQGFHAVASVKAQYETLNEEVSPSFSGLVSNTFADGKFGALVAVSHQERDVQLNQIVTAGYRTGITLTNTDGDVVAENATIPRNLDMTVDEQKRTRTNLSTSLQFAPNSDLTLTFDGLYSKFEVDSRVRDLAAWFEPNRVSSATIDPVSRTAIKFDQVGGNANTDFVDHTRNSRDVTASLFGFNADWQVNEDLKANFDLSKSSAKDDSAGQSRFNVIGIENTFSFDLSSGVPMAIHQGFGSGSLPSSDLARAHYNEIGGLGGEAQNRGATVEDDILEAKADFEYIPISDTLTSLKFGAHYQDREKQRFRAFGNAGCAFCGYHASLPAGLLETYTASNYFDGAADTWYTYDADAYFAYMGTEAAFNSHDTSALAQHIAAGNDPASFTSSKTNYGDGFVAVVQDDRYKVKEEVLSAYIDATFQGDFGDLPYSLNWGLRYSQTNTESTGVQAELTDIVQTSDPTLFSNVTSPGVEISSSSSYGVLLPSVNLKLNLTDDLILRGAIYDSLTRPTLSDLAPTTVYGEPRRQNLTANGGNAQLQPFRSENYDISLEWYYGDTSSFTVAAFNKDVTDWIVTLPGEEEFVLSDRSAPGFACSTCGAADDSDELNGASELLTVSRPQNAVDGNVNGVEIAWLHTFESGFGVQANATIVNSSEELNTLLEGLGDSQNLILFYENSGFQTRLAFNNRETFLRTAVNPTGGEPIYGKTYGQWDLSASYDINENINVFFEGINITEEEIIQHGRYANQVISVEDNGARFAVGVRGTF
ncbi:TonB-dependent receptor [Catenovulum agarivorans DS-2]|uniref:TonB-dependent receptor n=1 Tax=Catenovulum agarivorans DS-2 TaxID=1328313 RepID=W7QMN2_9ALTE|nr:TonB-dependent receptor [Catenovulum agarivorans]EWH10207.1 TonB-dependent receptor [Catenovulum agarivorans DS-2]